MLTIDPALDPWVWLAFLLFLVVIAARAWVVETGRERLGRTPAKVKVLTATTVVVLVGLTGLVVVQGGYLLLESIITGTDPSTTVYAPDPDEPADPPPADPNAPVDPNAPPVDPNAPAGGPAAPPPGG
jgi:hypothetical protein